MLGAETSVGTALAATGLPTAFAVSVVALRRSVRMQREADKLSADLDVPSQRLIRLEMRAASPDASAEAAIARDDGRVEELTAEMGLWGEIVRDLAVAVAAHDREVAALEQGRAEATRGPASSDQAVARPTETPPRPQLVAVATAAPAPPVAPAPPPADAPATKTQPRRAAAILAAVEEDRLEVHLQPVVSLPQRKIRLYEALVRLRLDEDTLLVPAEFLPVLERHGRTPDLDRKMLGRVATIARHMAVRGSDAGIACNIAPASLAEPGFLRTLGKIVDANPDPAGRLVLELPQRCWRTLDAEQAGGLAALRERGLAFSLDHASDLRLDPLSLADRGVRFVKLSAAMLLDQASSCGLDVEMKDLSAALQRAGIQLVAERVEREEDVPDLIDLDVPLAQGFVFAPPRPVRSDVMNGATPVPRPENLALERQTQNQAAVEASAAEPAKDATVERMPFRAFLRRAS